MLEYEKNYCEARRKSTYGVGLKLSVVGNRCEPTVHATIDMLHKKMTDLALEVSQIKYFLIKNRDEVPELKGLSESAAEEMADIIVSKAMTAINTALSSAEFIPDSNPEDTEDCDEVSALFVPE